MYLRISIPGWAASQFCLEILAVSRMDKGMMFSKNPVSTMARLNSMSQMQAAICNGRLWWSLMVVWQPSRVTFEEGQICMLEFVSSSPMFDKIDIPC